PPRAARLPAGRAAGGARPAPGRRHRRGARLSARAGRGQFHERDGELRVRRGERPGPQPGLMRYQLALFLTALGFFTRIPVPAWVPWSSERMSHAARYFALVGWVVGAAGALGYLALASLLPPAVAVILSMALTIRLTGAFHEDGFADSCDGLGG